MKVLQVLKTLRRGGAETVALELVRNLISPSHTFSVAYFLPDDPDLLSEFRALGVETHCLNATRSATLPAAIPALRALIKQGQFDIVHGHLPLPGIATRLAGVRTQARVVYTEHNLQDRYHLLTRLLNKVTWPLQDHVIAVSQQVAATIRSPFGNKPPVRVIYNGVPLDRFQDESARDSSRDLRKSLGLDDAPVVGTVAVMRHAKRLDRWLAAAKLILASEPSTRFLLVGGGPLEEDIRTEANRLGIESRVCFAGPQTDVLPFLALMDVFLSSSDYEGLPLAILEAMAFGVPVVAPPAGGVPEALIDGATGLLTDFSPSDLTTGVLKLLRAPHLCRQLGDGGRRLVHERFSSVRMAKETASVYSQERAFN